jgi:hypothetical protein
LIVNSPLRHAKEGLSKPPKCRRLPFQTIDLSLDGCGSKWRQVVDKLRVGHHKLAAFMDQAEDDVLAFMDFPPAHRVKPMINRRHFC